MTTQQGSTRNITIDCRGMRCPAPILEVSKAAKQHSGTSSELKVLANDRDFPSDIEAWCRSTGSMLIDFQTLADGTYVATLGLRGEEVLVNQSGRFDRNHNGRFAQSQQARFGSNPSGNFSSPLQEVDLSQSSPSSPMHSEPTQVAFEIPPNKNYPDEDILYTSTGDDTLNFTPSPATPLPQIERLVPRNFTPEPLKIAPVGVMPNPLPPKPLPLKPSQNVSSSKENVFQKQDASNIDLCGISSEMAILRISSLALNSLGKRLNIVSDTKDFASKLSIWTQITGAQITECVQENGKTFVTLLVNNAAETENASSDSSLQGFSEILSMDLQPKPLVAKSTNALTNSVENLAIAPTELAIQKKSLEHRGSLLVMHNDFEELLVSLLVATSTAAQGVPVSIFFCFWGVNFLRAKKSRNRTGKGPGIFERLLQWLTPKGPRHQKLGKLHLGGLGKGILGHLMKKYNVQTLEELMNVAVEQNIEFLVCGMSMELLGLQEEDLLDLPNMKMSGVTNFAEIAMRSKMNLAF